MDLPIKSEPANFESDILSSEIEDDMKIEQNSVTVCETNDRNFQLQNCKESKKKRSSQLCDQSGDYEADQLPLRVKKLLLRSFEQDGCSKETIEKLCATNVVNPPLAFEYIDKSAKDAQDFVYQECDSLSFNNITEWLKYLEVTGGPKDCNYEVAIALNAIAYNESHPEPAVIDGVDLKSIYKFLSHALMGLPQEKLDGTSAKFLSNEFQNLIDEANTDEADIEVRNMKRKIEDSLDNNCGGKIKGESLSLDPFNIAEFK